jgi:hypothetical protein
MEPRLVHARPAALCVGPGHRLVHVNGAFVAAFGEGCLGLPAAEVMLDLPPHAFELFATVLTRGRPLACWIRRGGRDWRLVAAPRTDSTTGEVYGLHLHLRERSDLPVLINPI